MNPTRILIDADVLAFRASAVVEEKVDWGDGEVEWVVPDVSEAIDAAKHLVDQVTSEIYGSLVMCASDSGGTFRAAINPSYKSNRANSRRPELLPDVHDWLRSNFQYETWTNLEADDVIGIMSSPEYDGTESIIVSSDKDFYTLPGRLFWRIWTKEESLGIQHVDPLGANLTLFKQILMGDRIDGYNGIPGVGEKKAMRMIDGWIEQWTACDRCVSDEEFWSFVWSCVEQAYSRSDKIADGLTEAHLSAHMAYILRGPESYMEDIGWVNLWDPAAGGL